jgi:branched-chain amino acid aminotransferase
MPDANSGEFTYYLDGKYVPMSEAKVFVLDPVCHGDSVFDTMRTVHRDRIFRVDDHIARLCASCRAADLEPRESPAELKDVCHALLERNRDLLAENDDAWILPRVAAGGQGGSSTVVAFAPLPFRRHAPFFELGTHLVVPTVRHVPPQCLDPKIKYDARLFMHIGEREAKRIDPDSRTLPLDIDGNVAELTDANVFIVKNGEVVTPPLRNTLPGVSKTVVLELCGSLGIPAAERDFQLFDVYNADEMFQTGTSYRMLPVSRVNQRHLWKSVPGPITAQLLEAYGKELGLDIAEQYLSHLDSDERKALQARSAR